MLLFLTDTLSGDIGGLIVPTKNVVFCKSSFFLIKDVKEGDEEQRDRGKSL